MKTAIGNLDICPKCGADRKQLKRMLKEPPDSDNWQIARVILLNCWYCYAALAHKIKGGKEW